MELLVFRDYAGYKQAIKYAMSKNIVWPDPSTKVTYSTITKAVPKKARTYAICINYNNITEKYEAQYQSYAFYKKHLLNNKQNKITIIEF